MIKINKVIDVYDKGNETKKGDLRCVFYEPGDNRYYIKINKKYVDVTDRQEYFVARDTYVL